MYAVIPFDRIFLFSIIDMLRASHATNTANGPSHQEFNQLFFARPNRRPHFTYTRTLYAITIKMCGRQLEKYTTSSVSCKNFEPTTYWLALAFFENYDSSCTVLSAVIFSIHLCRSSLLFRPGARRKKNDYDEKHNSIRTTLIALFTWLFANIYRFRSMVIIPFAINRV